MSERTIMPPKFTASDITAEISTRGPEYARRFSLIVAEDALDRLAPAVIPHVVERLAGQIAAEQRGSVEATVHEFLRDRAWAEPIIRQAIKDAVREHIQSIFAVARGGAAGSPE